MPRIITSSVGKTRRKFSGAVAVSQGAPSVVTFAQTEDLDAYQFLQSLPVLSNLPENELRNLANYCRFGKLASGQYVTIEGDEKSLYGFIVVSGRLSMLKTSVSGKELVVELLPPGDIFGLLQMLALEVLPAQLSARAQGESKVLWVPIQTLSHILDKHPVLYKNLLFHMVECLQASYRISRGLAHDRVEIRISAVLLSLAGKFSRPPPAAQDHTIDITRQQLADLTGTTPETAIRVTRSMQKAGLIEINHPGVIRVLDLIALQQIAEGV